MLYISLVTGVGKLFNTITLLVYKKITILAARFCNLRFFKVVPCHMMTKGCVSIAHYCANNDIID